VHSRRVVTSVVLAVALVAWCGFASGFHQSSTGAFVTWSISLAAVVAVNVGLARGREHRRGPAALAWPPADQAAKGRALAGISPWVVLGLVALAWELLGIDTSPDKPHLTISALSQLYRPLNAMLLLVWILAGLGYGAARARLPAKVRATASTAGLHKSEAFGAVAVVGVGLGRQMTMPALLLPGSRPVGVAFWLLVVGAAVFIDFTARRSEGRFANGGELIRLISRPAAARVVMVAAWAFAGWHLFAH
jgi:hypothetical protein